MCIVSPSIVLGISIFTSKTLEFGPVSIKNPEFALKSGLASVVLIPPSALNSKALNGILFSSFESVFASGS